MRLGATEEETGGVLIVALVVDDVLLGFCDLLAAVRSYFQRSANTRPTDRDLMSLKEEEGGCKTAILRGAGSCSWGTGSCWWGRRGLQNKLGLNACPSVQKPSFCLFAETRHRVGEKRDRCEAEVVWGWSPVLFVVWTSDLALGRADKKDKARDREWYLPCHSGKQRATKALSRGIRRLVRDDDEDDDERVEGRGRTLDAWSQGRTPMGE